MATNTDETFDPVTLKSTPAPQKAVNQIITSDSYNLMLQICEDIMDHKHTFKDDYYSNCECQCGRGTL